MMATIRINRPRWSADSAEPTIELSLDFREAAELTRVVNDRQSTLPIPQWLQDFVRVT